MKTFGCVRLDFLESSLRKYDTFGIAMILKLYFFFYYLSSVLNFSFSFSINLTVQVSGFFIIAPRPRDPLVMFRKTVSGNLLCTSNRVVKLCLYLCKFFIITHYKLTILMSKALKCQNRTLLSSVEIAIFLPHQLQREANQLCIFLINAIVMEPHEMHPVSEAASQTLQRGSVQRILLQPEGLSDYAAGGLTA